MKNEAMKDIAKNVLNLGESVYSALIPEEAKIHFRHATKELLLGIVVLLDEKDKAGTQNDDSAQQTGQDNKSQKIDIT